MANIIIIDDDDRVRRQMEMFLAELGDENRIRSFKTLAEFEALYFRAEQAVKVKAIFPDHPQLRTLTADQQAWLVEQKIPKVPPFPFPTLRIELDPTIGKVKKLEPMPSDDINLFGMPLANFQLQTKVLETLLPTPFQKTYQEFVGKLVTGKPAQTIMCFFSNTSEVWIMQMTMTQTAQSINVQLEDLTAKLTDSIQQAKDKISAQSGDEEEDELKLLSDIDLVVVKSNFLPKKPLPWFDTFHANLKKFNLYSAEFRTRLIVTKYEDDGLEKVELTHPLVDDVIYLPLDRLIFLQKVEIIVGLPKQVTPSFLFSQEVALEIEIAKRSTMEKLADVALAIRNPVPLVPGLIGHFFIDLPGEKVGLEVYGKVARSEPHPGYPGESLVYFSYFGAPKETQTKIRRHLSKDPHYKSLLNENKKDFLFNPDDLFLTEEEKRPKNIIVVDSDPDSSSQLLDILKEDVEQVQIAAFSTYSSFLSKYFEDKAAKIDLAELAPATPKDVFGGQSIWIVSKEEKDLIDYSPPSVAGSTLLGHTVEELFKEKQAWKNIFSKEHETLLEEIYSIVSGGRNFQAMVFFTDKLGKPRALDLKATQQPRGIQFTLTIPKQEDVKDSLMLQSKFSNWDLLVIDSALLPADPAEWIANMETNAKNRGYLKANESLKIIVLESAVPKHKAASLKAPQIRGMVLRPVEPRSFLYNVSSALDLPYTAYRFSNIGWSNQKLAIQVAKEAKLANLAEFGAAIRHARPIAPGTFLYLRGSIFNNAPRNNLCAKFYACEEDPNEKGVFICSLIYFGINEAFNKFARSWFRETYAQSKQVES